jgi:O-glycosyl hydrolase
VPRILKASGAGKPDDQSVRQRAELRDLCRKYALPAWMTEVSHAEVDPRSLDHLRGRAIHIHDEMVYADAAAFYGMNAFWDAKTHDAHFAGRANAGLLSEEDTIVLADNAKESVLITGMGYAIGHYARWIKRGAVRLEAASSDDLVQVTAFRDAAAGRLVLVVINNAPAARTLEVTASRLALKGAVVAEQSVAHRYWEKLKEFAPAAADRFGTQLPPLSVTTFAAALAGPAPTTTAPK